VVGGSWYKDRLPVKRLDHLEREVVGRSYFLQEDECRPLQLPQASCGLLIEVEHHPKEFPNSVGRADLHDEKV